MGLLLVDTHPRPHGMYQCQLQALNSARTFPRSGLICAADLFAFWPQNQQGWGRLGQWHTSHPEGFGAFCWEGTKLPRLMVLSLGGPDSANSKQDPNS